MVSHLQILIFLTTNLIILIISPIFGAEISSKIDLDDDNTTPPATLSSSVLKAFVDINQGAGLTSKPSGITSKLLQPSRGFRQSGMRPANIHEADDDDDDYISIEDLFKKKRQQIQQNPLSASFSPNAQSFYGESDVKPTIINNIHVTINANESGPGVNGCKNGVCDVRVISKPDAEGNVITNVHLSVVTKMNKPPLEVADIPVIEGTTGIRTPQFDQLPAFHFVDQNVRYGGPYFDNNIPQIPIHRQDVDSWYHPTIRHPTILERPRPVWHYGRNLDRSFKDSQSSQGRRGWTESRNRGIVDDKIEPPLSKTKSNSEED